jgi:hypothetical protein
MIALGSVEFADFEVPAQVRFGGSQRLLVHALPSGGRVIDAFGPDEDDVRWSGVLSGAQASDRARLLDAMRTSGGVLPLRWGAFYAVVIVAELQLDFRNPWWIPYAITCKVTEPPPADDMPDLTDLLLADVDAAAAFWSVGSLPQLLSASDVTAAGTPANAAAVLAFGNAQANVGAQIGTAESGMGSADLPAVIASSGSLAQLVAAQGFLSRASTNLSDTGE